MGYRMNKKEFYTKSRLLYYLKDKLIVSIKDGCCNFTLLEKIYGV